MSNRFMIAKLRRSVLWILYFSVLSAALSCASAKPAGTLTTTNAAKAQTEKAAINSVPVIHVFVALADNVNQGIVPVSASLGNGDNAKTNLYWGAAFGVRTFFSKNKDWELISVTPNPTASVLERCIFKHRLSSLLLIADAYRGKEISQTIWDFLEAAANPTISKSQQDSPRSFRHPSLQSARRRP